MNRFPQLAATSVASRPLATLLLLGLGIPLSLWCLYTLIVGDNLDQVGFFSAAGCFLLLAFVYVGIHGFAGLDWFSVPFLFTLRGLVEFCIIPFWRLLAGETQMDPIYTRAMWLCVGGFTAFWVASLLVLRNRPLVFAPRGHFAPSRVALWSALLLVVGLVGHIVLWKMGMAGYGTADDVARESALPFLGWLHFAASLLNVALVISAVEVLGKGSKNSAIRWIFIVSLAAALVFGIISGMKEELLTPFVFIAFVIFFAKGRFPRVALFLPLLLILIYPFVTAYRETLSRGYRYVANTVPGQAEALASAFQDAITHPFSMGDESSAAHTAFRVDSLNDLHDVLGLPVPELIASDSRIWLAPFYPFIPRALWRDKPVLDEGSRFSVALGRTASTASAPTVVGDLYARGGDLGVLAGMFAYGLALQWFANWFRTQPLSEPALCIYILMLIPLVDLEVDMTMLIASAVTVLVKVFLVMRLVYGSERPRASRVAAG